MAVSPQRVLCSPYFTDHNSSYQPFLYYLIHARPRRPSTHQIVSPSYGGDQASTTALPGEASGVLWNLILRGIDCNLTILDTRSLPHRHHGLWYDLRAIMCASVILLAIVRAGYIDLVPGGAGTLVGVSDEWARPHLQRRRTLSSHSTQSHHVNSIGGKFGKVLAQLKLWSVESPDMRQHAEVLEALVREIMG